MSITPKLFLLYFLFLSTAAFAVNSQPAATRVTKPVTANAFYRDDQIWPTTNIPVCWENLATILSKPVWKQRRINTLAYVNAAWGNTTTTATAAGSTSLLRFTDYGQCPAVSAVPAFTGIRVLASSTLLLDLPFPYIDQLPPYVSALGNKLKNKPNGVVLDLDNKRIYNGSGSCKAQLISEENCFKAVVIHEFGHVIGISHEHNRIDQPLPYYTRLCAIDDPTTVQGYFAIGNLRIGTFDTTSIMDYCNDNRLKLPVLSTLDKLGVRVFYANMPTYSTDTGYPVIRIPLAIVNGVAKSITLSDQNKDGYYNYANASTTNKSSIPAGLTNGVLSIPYLKVMSFGKVTGIQRRTMKLVNPSLAANTAITNLYTTLRQ